MSPERPFLLCFNDPELAAHIAALGLPIALFLAGLAGSMIHCLGMCGPFVLGQVAGKAESGGAYGELRRLRDGALLPYHLGRITTYSLLGALAGGVGRALFAAPSLRFAAAALLALAGAALAAQALSHKLLVGFALPGLARLVGFAAGKPAPHSFLALWRFGLLLGFLPCGFLWGALAAAAASGSVVGGAAAMAGFGLGTMPALVGMGWGGALFGRRHGPLLRRLALPLQGLNALFLFWISARLFAGL